MPLEQLANIAEISAAVLVIVSLMYVGAQIKQNTKATVISTSQAFVDTFATAVVEISRGKEFTDIFWRGLSGLSNLHGSETAAFGAWSISTFRTWESFYYQWQEGVFDSDTRGFGRCGLSEVISSMKSSASSWTNRSLVQSLSHCMSLTRPRPRG